MPRQVQLKCNTVICDKFVVGYFHMTIVCGKIFPSLGVSNDNFFTTNDFMVKLFSVAYKLMNYT